MHQQNNTKHIPEALVRLNHEALQRA